VLDSTFPLLVLYRSICCIDLVTGIRSPEVHSQYRLCTVLYIGAAFPLLLQPERYSILRVTAIQASVR